jgi:ACT domain-containing protein
MQHEAQYQPFPPKEQTMNATSKSTKGATPISAGDLIDTAALVSVYLKGMERVADLQKNSLEVAAEYNAEAIEAYKKALKAVPSVPGLFVFDLAEQAFDHYIETQKSVIDMVVEQSASLVESVKERGGSAATIAADLAKMAQQTMERGIALQKNALEFAAQQTKTLTDATSKQLGLSGTPVAAISESFQKGVDALFETQKDLLEIATKPLKAAVAKVA